MTKMLCYLASMLPLFAWAQIEAKVNVAKPGHDVPKSLYGIFYEDINYAGDGGLYPELIANRGFDWPTQNLEGWKKDFRGGAMARVTRQFGNPVHPNTAQYLRLETFGAGTGCGVRNEGFGGIAVQKGKSYDLSFYARGLEGYKGSLLVVLEDENNTELARYAVQNSELSIGPVSDTARVLPLPEWKRYSTVFKPSASCVKAHLSVLMDQRGTVDIEFVSLFPQETYAGRKNGLRKDLVEWLKGMKPGVMRFPGGCIIEGVDYANRYDWQRTVGSLESRPVNGNLWGYWQTHGLGYFEYFQLCEDIGADPMPIVTAGLTCQFRKAEFLPLEALDVQAKEILELIEFANGSVSTKWGQLRAETGHPKPFNMKYVGIGNENWDKVFLDRYLAIQKIVKAKHPEIQIISSAGAGPSGHLFEMAWKTLDAQKADLVDEHYYVPPAFLLNGVNRYDTYDRKGPKVYVGEYACHLPNRANSLYSALCEAAMMTGFERNSDVVEMTSYAPLFNKIGNSQWTPDLIWFDNVKSFGTPNYYVQALFGNHLPSVILPTEYSTAKVKVEPAGRIGLNGWDTAMEFKDVLVKQGDKLLYAFDPAKGLEGWKAVDGGAWSVKEGVIAQTKTDSRSVLSIGDTRWKDYTLTLKARKTGGEEGFIIRVRDNNQGFVHFNFGGWGNKEHGIGTATENSVVRKPGTIIQNKWYDVKVVVAGECVSAWLDGEAVFEKVAVPAQHVNSFFMVSGLDKNTREIVVKCVNVSESEQTLNLQLEGAAILPQKAKRIQLSGEREGVNTLEQPTYIAPLEDTVEVNSNTPVLTLAPMSLTIFRIATTSAQPPVPRCTPLPLEDVRLTSGPLKQAQDKNAEYLLQLEPDRMLAFLRKRAGLEPKAKGYGGWDGDGRNLTGHICGHYLSAVSILFAATGDNRFKERVAYIVDQLEEVQKKNGNGYLGALEGGQEMFAQVAKGEIRSGGFDLNGQWAPFYTLHKMYAGLRDAYRFAGNTKALQLEVGFAVWCETILKDLNDEQIQKMLNTEFGGMNEVFADLYKDTGDERWLKLSYTFEHHLILDPLKQKKDDLAGKHGNTQVPKVQGSLARYFSTGDPTDYTAASFFWDRVALHHSYVTGGHGKDEYFGEPDKLNDRVDGRTCETCNVYNMLKLTRRLFMLKPEAVYADFHERALYNHILSSFSPTTGQTCYMVPVGRGVQREYSDMLNAFTCCVGSGMESHALHANGIYYASADQLMVTIFADSKAFWKANGVTLEQKTDFPIGERVQFTFTMDKPKTFTFTLRKPKWVADGFGVQINGHAETSPVSDHWLNMKRTWKHGDVVEVILPKTLRLEATPDNPKRAAVMWGPLVLAGDLGEENTFESWKPGAVPVMVTDNKEAVADWLKPVTGEALGTFKTEGIGQDKDVVFKPFYLLQHRTYGIYWDFFTKEEWNVQKEQYVAEQQRIEKLVAATVGFAQPGEMQPERDYNQQGEETWADRVAGRACRRGKKWFSFDMPVDEKEQMTLSVTYYKDEWRKRTFTISADGVKLGEQVIPGREGLKFFDVSYPLPAELMKGKKKLTIRFDATEGNEIGAVFGLRTYRASRME